MLARVFASVLRGVALAALATAGLLPVSNAQAAGPGSWTQAQVNGAIADGVAYLDKQQNANGSYGNGLVAETGMALAAYGVLANGNFSTLPASYQTHVRNAINFLLANQGPSAGIPGAFSPGFYPTYSTGLAILGLSPFTGVNPAVPGAIASGRSFLTSEFQGPAYTSCNSADGSSTSSFCGGWNYETGKGRSDESNSGYAMTGLEVTGGVPAALVPDNINWNHHIQVISTNPFTQPIHGGSGFNDGGGSYQPFDAAAAPNFLASNANDSGTMLFSYAFDGLPSTDPNVAAATTFSLDVLNTYEDDKPSYAMVFHNAPTEDGHCKPGVTGCHWFDDGDGGFHYSVFALTKGLGFYIPANLSDPSNWYAKVVDLLLSQQKADGSWPADGRDDYDAVFATGLSVSSLGLVAVPPTITLAPSTQTLAVDGSATVTATLMSGGNPVSGVLVSFMVTAGPNSGKTGTAVTDASGNASFTYSDSGGAGTDTTVATFTDLSGRLHTSNTATEIWQSAGSDTTPPSCALAAVIAGPPKQLQITVQDSDGGLKSIAATTISNATVAIPAFTTGTTSPVVVTATKIDQATGATVTLEATDLAGNVNTCDPAMVTVNGSAGKAVSKVVTGVAQAESIVSIYNSRPGLKQLDVKVNGEIFKVTRLHDGEVRTINVASGLKAGNHNTIVLTPRGNTGSADVLISDMGKQSPAQHGTTHVVVDQREQQEDTAPLD
jgi:hypothetical protein